MTNKPRNALSSKYTLEELRLMNPKESFNEFNQALWRGDDSVLKTHFRNGDEILKAAKEREKNKQKAFSAHEGMTATL